MLLRQSMIMKFLRLKGSVKFTSRLTSALVLLAVIILIELFTHMSPPFHVPVERQRIAIDVKPSVIFEHRISPSFAELESLGFTDVGTDLDPYLLEDLTGMLALHDWLESAHRSGFQAFASIGSNSSLQLVKTAVALGFDYVEFDEFLSSPFMSEESFQSLMLDIIQVSSVPILVTESLNRAFQEAVLFARQHVNIMVASDDYQNISSLSAVYRIGEVTGVSVAVWIIFIPDPQNVWNTYVNLRSWTLEALTLGLSTYFYAVIPEGTWTGNWPMLRELLEIRQISLVLSATKQIIIVTLLAMAAWSTYSLALQIIKGLQTKKRGQRIN